MHPPMSTNELRRRLGIHPQQFQASIRQQARLREKIYEEAINASKETSRAFDKAAKEIQKAQEHLREAIQYPELKEVSQFLDNARVRLESISRQHRKVMGGRHRPRTEIEGSLAASELYEKMKTSGIKQIGYHGALLSHELGYDPTPPCSTSRNMDKAVNRFWERKKVGDTLQGK